MIARDFMTTDLITSSRDTSLEKIADIMVEEKISGVPVVDENNELIGLVTENDLLARARKIDLPTYMPFIGGIIYLENPQRLDEDIRKMTAVNAGEVMTTDIHTVDPDTSVEEIATLMNEKRVNRLPVVENGKLVGIITRSDVVRAVASTE